MNKIQQASANKSYELYRNIQKNIVMGFYYISIIAIYIGLTYILWNFVNISFSVLIGITILYFTICAVVGIILFIIIDIAIKINYKFDVIKNDIASKDIKTPYDFARRTGEFLCDFLSFSFFDVSHTVIKIPNTEYYFSNSEIEGEIGQDLSTILEKSKSTSDLFCFGKYDIESRSMYLYILPIWFGQTWLGYIGIFTNRKLWKVFQNFLADFENHFIDDQLMHVIDYHIISIQKEMYREIDLFSNKIISGYYKSMPEYQEDILNYLTDRLKCKGGIFKTADNKQIATLIPDLNESDTNKLLSYYKLKSPSDSFKIYSDPDNKLFKYVFDIPVKSEKHKGIIYLFDDDNTRFNFFKDILAEIEDFKLGSDLGHLANQLSN